MNMIKKTKPPRRADALKLYVEDLGKAPVQRSRSCRRRAGGSSASARSTSTSSSVVERTFLCDRHRCIQWTPHEKMKDKKPLIDRSCCSRYTVPVTDLDLDRVAEILPLVRKRLDKNHPYRDDPNEPHFEVQEDFSFALRERENGTCQFVVYDEGRTACAIHKTCLEEGLDPWVYKPLGCSMWPLAILDYEDEAGERSAAADGLHARDRGAVRQRGGRRLGGRRASSPASSTRIPEYDPMYRACQGVITHAFGADFYRKLDAAAQKHLARG